MSRTRRHAVMLAILLCITFCCVAKVKAQATSGTILGRVTDPQEGAVVGATVTAKNEETGLSRDTRSNGEGEYTLSNLPPGRYTVTVVQQGFTTATSNDNKLEIDQKLRLDVALTVGNVSETVSVTSDSPLLQTQSAETGQVVENKRIEDLPLLGRNFLDLTRLTTGVTTGAGGNNTNIAVNGQREFGNSIQVDGVEVTANRNNDTNVRPSVDAVQEFKISTSAYAPEFGRAAGAVIAIQTKSGSNTFHGTAYEFFRPGATAARAFFAPARSGLNQHNFGATFGGRLVKDKTFFFASYEGVRLRDTISFLDSVPPIDQIRFLSNGDVDLSGLRDPLTGNQVPIFDPAFYAQNFFSQQFPGNIIPANRVSAAGRAILQNFFPRPNTTGILNGYFSNYIVSSPYRFRSDTVDLRGDHTFSAKDNFSVVYHVVPFHILSEDRFAGAIPVEGGGSADIADKEDSVNQSLALAETHVFSSRFVNEFRFGYYRSSLDQNDLIGEEALADQFGARNLNLSGFPQTLGFPQVQLGTGYITGGSTFKPLTFLDSNFQFLDTLSGHVGSHDMKAGVDLRFLSAHPTFSLFPTGYFFFGGAFQSLTADPNFGFFDQNAFFGNGGSDIADLLLGLPQVAFVGLQLTDPKTKSHETAFFVQDSWQVNKRLVLNYGVRYEYQSPYVEENDNLSNFDPTTLTYQLAGRGSNSRTLVNPDKNNFMPRVGAALRLTDSTVLRAGYGVFFTPENDARSDVLTKNFPFATRSNFFNSVFNGLPFAYTIDTGVPRNTTVQVPSGASSINATTIPNANVQSIFFVDQNFRTGYSQLFNVVLQHQLTRSLNVEAGYVGSVSHKLPYAIGNINLGNRISSRLGEINGQFSIGDANYHSLQVKADKRFSNGYSFFVAYTFAKSIDNGPAPFNLGSNNQRPQNPFNLAAERAVSSNDIRHNLVASYIYELPFGRGQHFLNDANSVVNALFGGWQINGLLNVRSGLPVNVVRSAPQGFEGLRPNLTGDPALSDGTLDRFFNTGAFSAAGLAATQPGSAGRNILRGPEFANLDFSTFKNVTLSSIREGMRLQLRFEFFNLTNTPHFANPNAVFGSGNFGRITGTVGNPRIIQFAAKVIY